VLTKGDKVLLSLWADGVTLDVAARKLRKTPTSIASKLVRLGVCKDRASVNVENGRRGGISMATLGHDGAYTVYLVRDPSTKAPIYVGQTQNFRKRKKSHIRHFSTLLAGQIPLIEEVRTVENYALAREMERAVIADLSNARYILQNVLDREEGNV
jgi:predicted GIY-YIG superfamily endonuclease